MVSQANLQSSKPTFHLTFHLQQKSPQTLSFSSFSRDLTKSTRFRSPVIKASSSSSSSSSNPKPSLLKTTFISLTASMALFSASLNLVSKPALATTVTTTTTEETILETNVEALLSLAKEKFDSGKFDETVKIINGLIEMEPDKQQWQHMRAKLLLFSHDTKAAIKAFEEILAKDTLNVEAYHYLVMEYHYSKPKLEELEMRIEEAIVRCKKEKKRWEVSEFKMLIALIRFPSFDTWYICKEVVTDDLGVLFQAMAYMWNKQDDVKISPRKEKATKEVSKWRVIVTYDRIYCYMNTVVKLSIASTSNRFIR